MFKKYAADISRAQAEQDLISLTNFTIKNGKLSMNMEDYIKEVIRKYEAANDLTLKKENNPMPVDCKPELDKSELLDTKQHKEFQHIIGL